MDVGTDCPPCPFSQIFKIEEMFPVVTFAVLPVRYSPHNEFMRGMNLIDTRKFYKLYFVSSGSSAICINNRLFVLDAGDIIFQSPGDRLSFQTSENGNAYLCLVHTDYLSSDSIYLLDLFRHFPLFLVHGAVIALDSMQSEISRLAFESIIAEQESRNPDKKQATLLHLQMILLQIQRAGRKRHCIRLAYNTMEMGCIWWPPLCYS